MARCDNNCNNISQSNPVRLSGGPDDAHRTLVITCPCHSLSNTQRSRYGGTNYHLSDARSGALTPSRSHRAITLRAVFRVVLSSVCVFIIESDLHLRFKLVNMRSIRSLSSFAVSAHRCANKRRGNDCAYKTRGPLDTGAIRSRGKSSATEC